MGATSWQYWVSYQKDVQGALDRLRKEVFEALPIEEKAKAFELTLDEYMLRMASNMGMELDQDELEDFKEDYADEVESFQQTPIETRYVLYYGYEGTGTVLDVDKVGETREELDRHIGWMRPLSSEEYQKIFGTDKPSREMIEKLEEKDAINSLCVRYEGIYVIAFANDKATEIYFTGSSGD